LIIGIKNNLKMAESQLARCREMAAQLADTEQAQAASVIMAVVNETAADKRLGQALVDFAVKNAHQMLYRLLRFETEVTILGTDWRNPK
jgi:hypothetical protein